MRQKIMALFVIILFVASTPAYALDIINQQDLFSEEELGEDIIINVDDYQPKIIRSSLLEEKDVNVYATLKGIPSNPTISISKIDDIDLKATKISTPDGKEVKLGNIRYVKPGRANFGLKDAAYELFNGRYTGDGIGGLVYPQQLNYDNLGYVVVPIKRIPKEADVPSQIDITMEGRIRFDVSSDLGAGPTTDVLRPMTNSEWNKVRESHKFYGGYLQVTSIEPSTISRLFNGAPIAQSQQVLEKDALIPLENYKAKIVLYNNQLNPIIPGIGFEDDNTGTGNSDLQITAGTLVLKPGETSRRTFRTDSAIESAQLGSPKTLFNRFRVRLEEIRSQRPSIRAFVQSSDQLLPVLVTISEGDRVHSNSDWVFDGVEHGVVNNVGSYKVVFKKFRIGDNIETKIVELDDQVVGNELKLSLGLDISLTRGTEQHTGLLRRAIEEYETFLVGLESVNMDSLDPNDKETLESEQEEAMYQLGSLSILLGETDKGLNELKDYLKMFPAGTHVSQIDRFISGYENVNTQNAARTISFDEGSNEMSTTITVLSDPIEFEGGRRSIAKIRVGDNIGVYNQGDTLCVDKECTNQEWKVSEIGQNQVVLKKGDTRSLLLTGSSTELGESITAELVSANPELEAVITILPVPERAYSSINFDMHIPIESRALELPLFTGSLDKEINKTQELIKKLDGVIKNVEKVHNVWSKLCLTTFLVLWSKNLFSLDKGAARKRINPIWKERWSKDESAQNSGVTFDNYLLQDENKEAYENDLTNAERIIGEIDNKKYLESSLSLTDAEKKKYDSLLQERYFALELSKTTPEYVAKFIEKELEVQNIKVLSKIKNLETQPYSEIANDIERIWWKMDPVEWARNKEGFIRTYYLTETAKTMKTFLNEGENKILGYYPSDNEGIKDEVTNALGGLLTASPTEQVSQDTIPITSIIKKDALFYFSANNGEMYPLVDSNAADDPIRSTLSQDQLDGNMDVYYVIGQERKTARISNDIKEETHLPKVTTYPKGHRQAGHIKQVSVDAYHYIEFEYSSSGKINKKTVYRRGIPNEDLGGGTLVGELDNSLLFSFRQSKDGKLEKLANDLSKAESCLNKLNRKLESSFIPASIFSSPFVGNSVSCSGLGEYTVTKEKVIKSEAECSDFMDPQECRILFNACDPVICPSSRCNLGGKWQVERVTETGLVGSIALCAPNFPEVVVPVCITGINAGLQNIKSILEGYNQCLVAHKNEGTSVGICDSIRNVYICEILWKEGLAIFNVKGGFLGLISEKLFKIAGGGEYSSFEDHFDQSVAGLQYFTQDYAKNVFASYDGGSLDEIGTQICKSAIYGKAPGVGNFFNEIQKPESPPQFFAFFDEVPYTDLLNVPQSQYEVFYHIYAGQNEDVRYSVYLQEIDGAGRLIGNYKFLKNNQPLTLGQSVDENEDFVARAGYNQLCVSILTRRYGRIVECGFGEVSTNFAIDYLTEQYALSEINKKVDTEEECVTDRTRITSLSAPSTISDVNLLQAGVGSFSTGLTQTGIVRKCAGVDPNIGFKDGIQRWVGVGTCGNDKQGRDLGICWLYKPAAERALEQEYSKQLVDEGLEKVTEELKEEGLGVSGLSRDEVDEIKRGFRNIVRLPGGSSCDNAYPIAIGYYEEIRANAILEWQRVEANYLIAEALVKEYKCLSKQKIDAATAPPGNAGPSPAPTDAIERSNVKADKCINLSLAPSSTESTVELKVKENDKIIFTSQSRGYIYVVKGIDARIIELDSKERGAFDVIIPKDNTARIELSDDAVDDILLRYESDGKIFLVLGDSGPFAEGFKIDVKLCPN